MNREANKKCVIVCEVLIASSIAFQCFNIKFITEMNFLYGLAYTANALSLILAFIYLLKGYKKADAKLYKAFLITYGISLLTTSSSMVAGAFDRPIITRALIPNYAMMYGILMVLACAENLGEKKAMRFAYSNLILVGVLFASLVIFNPGVFRGGEVGDTAILINFIKYFDLAIVLVVTTRSKYVDKAERGTK